MDIVHLQSGAWKAAIQLQGAEIASVTDPDGHEKIWQADPAVWARHAPVLFPVCGSVKNQQVIVEGKSYPMPKHGFMQGADFRIGLLGDDFVELIREDDEASRACYPFRFRLHVIHRLGEAQITTTFVVENLDDRVMPFCIGGHPAFAITLDDQHPMTDYILRFEQAEEGRNCLVPNDLVDGFDYLPGFRNSRVLPLSHEILDEKDSLLFADLKSRRVELLNRFDGHGVRLSFPKFEALAVWTKAHLHAPYLCLEPWHGIPATVEESGKFEEKRFVTLLQPGMSWQGSFTAEWI